MYIRTQRAFAVGLSETDCVSIKKERKKIWQIKKDKKKWWEEKTLDIAYGIYKTDGPGVLTPKMQEVMDKYINLEIDYEEYRKQLLASVGIIVSDDEEDDNEYEDDE